MKTLEQAIQEVEQEIKVLEEIREILLKSLEKEKQSGVPLVSVQ